METAQKQGGPWETEKGNKKDENLEIWEGGLTCL